MKLSFAQKMIATGGLPIERNKPDTERQIYVLRYMWERKSVPALGPLRVIPSVIPLSYSFFFSDVFFL